MTSPFQVLAKPVGAACNLACRYCYYLPGRSDAVARRMGDDTLEAYVRECFAGQPSATEVCFSWQGGEPTLAGSDFFRRALALQARYAPPGVRVSNAFQTNGTLIDEGWAAFLAEHAFLVGVSIDGPARLHDPLRRGRDGRASHAAALRGFERLLRAGAETNTLTVVHRLNYAHGHEVYRFLRRIGARHLQFIPLVERLGPDGTIAPPSAPARAPLAPWAAPRDGYGRFLCDVFDDWLARDVGTVFVQQIEEYAGALAGSGPHLCVHGIDCSRTPMLEANGDLYSCDHYAFPAYRLGNIHLRPIAECLDSPQQLRFGAAKRGPLPTTCARCPQVMACVGGCPRHRIVEAPAGDPPHNYLCPSYQRFYAHAGPALARVLSNPAAAPASRG